MKIQDYIHFYMGCDILMPNGRKCKLSAVLLQDNYNRHVKPILRTLDSMTDEESEILFHHLVDTCGTQKSLTADAEQTRWLLERQFDVFGLIKAGLALDATKLTTPVK